MGQEREVEIHDRRAGREAQLPQPQPFGLVGRRERDAHVDAPDEAVVDVAGVVRGEDGQPVEAFELLEQVARLEVRVAVVRVGDLGALGEHRIGLVEEQDHRAALGRSEDPVEVLLGLPDVLRHDGSEVDAEQVEPELAGDDFGRQGLAGARRTGEERDNAGRRQGAEPPVSVHLVAVAIAVDDLVNER